MTWVLPALALMAPCSCTAGRVSACLLLCSTAAGADLAAAQQRRALYSSATSRSMLAARCTVVTALGLPAGAAGSSHVPHDEPVTARRAA